MVDRKMVDRKKNYSKKLTKENIAKLSFENAYNKLEEIVNQFEEGELMLNDMVNNYEYTTLLVNHCTSLLDNAKLKISKLEEENGKFKISNVNKEFNNNQSQSQN